MKKGKKDSVKIKKIDAKSKINYSQNKESFLSRWFVPILLLLVLAAITLGVLFFNNNGITGKIILEDYTNTGYADPTNVFFISPETFSSGQSTISINANVSKSGGYVYKTGYYWNSKLNDWTAFEFSGTVVGNNYIANSTTKSLNIPSENLNTSGANYIVSYACTKVNGAWKCGCESSSDTNCNKWYIQIFTINTSSNYFCTSDSNCSNDSLCYNGVCILKPLTPINITPTGICSGNPTCPAYASNGICPSGCTPINKGPNGIICSGQVNCSNYNSNQSVCNSLGCSWSPYCTQNTDCNIYGYGYGCATTGCIRETVCKNPASETCRYDSDCSALGYGCTSNVCQYKLTRSCENVKIGDVCENGIKMSNTLIYSYGDLTPSNFYNASANCEKLNMPINHNWRLPTRQEILSGGWLTLRDFVWYGFWAFESDQQQNNGGAFSCFLNNDGKSFGCDDTDRLVKQRVRCVAPISNKYTCSKNIDCTNVCLQGYGCSEGICASGNPGDETRGNDCVYRGKLIPDGQCVYGVTHIIPTDYYKHCSKGVIVSDGYCD